MSREYRMPDGTPVPAELQDQIADDVRAFDASQEPAARMAVTLRKIGNDLPRLKGVITDLVDATRETNRIAERRTTALELQTLADMGYTARQLRETEAGRSLIGWYGLGDPGWPAAAQKMTIEERSQE